MRAWGESLLPLTVAPHMPFVNARRCDRSGRARLPRLLRPRDLVRLRLLPQRRACRTIEVFRCEGDGVEPDSMADLATREVVGSNVNAPPQPRLPRFVGGV